MRCIHSGTGSFSSDLEIQPSWNSLHKTTQPPFQLRNFHCNGGPAPDAAKHSDTQLRLYFFFTFEAFKKIDNFYFSSILES